MSKVNRNDPCPCGSGKKYKKCCGLKEQERKKSRLGMATMFPQGSVSKKNPTLNLAQKVFKVLTSPQKASQEPAQEAQPGEADSTPKSYGSLEELIGVEGAPNAEGGSPEAK